MDNKELISVIVPMYNVEKYLDGCLTSILKQTYTNLEIILIDDGSTDKSYSICKKYEKKDSRIKIIQQENMGLSAARNTGLDNMKGDYCVFIDSDDYILDTMIEELYELSKEYDADISNCQYHEVNTRENINLVQPTKEKIEVFIDDKKYSKMYSDYEHTVVQWNKLFKKHIFADLRFPVGRYHEDEFMIHHEMYRAKKVVFTNRKLYVYFRHKDSITGEPTTKKMYDATLGMLDAVEFYTKHKLYNYRKSAITRMCVLINKALNTTKDCLDFQEYSKKIIDIKNEYILSYIITKCKIILIKLLGIERN